MNDFDPILDLIHEMPDELKDLKMPEFNKLLMYRDYAKRIYRIDCDIDDAMLDLVDMIARCNVEDAEIPVEERRPIKVFISSCGGDTAVMWSIMKAIQISKTPVWTINLSYAYSAAAMILLAGHRRLGFPGCTTMLHRGSCILSGEQSTVESAQKFYHTQEKKYEEFIFSHTKIDPKKYKQKASSDMFYDDDEALANAIIDEIIADFTILK